MTEEFPIRVKRLPHAPEVLPAYATAGAAGFDLLAAENAEVWPGHRCLIRTGLCFEIPLGMEMQVRPRSGLAAKHGITVLNAPGTIDSDFRGEVAVILLNTSELMFEVRRGDRIAQGVIAPVHRAAFVEVEELSDTARGAGGFGSTGV